jgi:hypothetical protein
MAMIVTAAEPAPLFHLPNSRPLFFKKKTIIGKSGAKRGILFAHPIVDDVECLTSLRIN